MSNRIPGVVRRLKESYGFISGHDGNHYFFHWTAVLKESGDFRQLQIGDRVEFSVFQADRGPRAIDVVVVKVPVYDGGRSNRSMDENLEAAR